MHEPDDEIAQHDHDDEQQRRQCGGDAVASLRELIEDDRPHEAIDLLEPLAAQYPRVAPLHHTIAAAYALLGNLWSSLAGFERAYELTRDPVYWEPLARLYGQLEMNAHAVHAFRQLLRWSSRRASGDTAASAAAAVIAFEIMRQNRRQS